QLRNMGTIGGNVCLDTRCNWYDQSLFWRTAEGFCMKTNPEVVCRVATSSPRCLAVASADTVPALLVLGATVHLEDADGGREVALADLYREDGIRAWTMHPDEVLTDITLPRAGAPFAACELTYGRSRSSARPGTSSASAAGKA